MVEIEWDEEKRCANIQKHGLDFDDAKNLDWDAATYIEDKHFSYPEPRFWAFAQWKGRLYILAFCRRGNKVRIISFRKANQKEARRYGKQI